MLPSALTDLSTKPTPSVPFSLDRDAWLSSIMRRDAFRVSWNLAQDLLIEDLAVDQFETTTPAFYYTKVPTDQIAVVRAAGEAGFFVVDVNVLLEITLSMVAACKAPDCEVREANHNDFKAVAHIAATTFQFSRFHLDPLISNETADAIKRKWVENCLNGSRGSGVLVAVVNGEVAGFLAMIQSQVDGKRCQTIDLIGVSRRFQRRGVGRDLVHEFLRRYASETELFRVGTQVANAPSIRLYEQCGFRFKQSSYVMHAHFPRRNQTSED